MSGQGLAPSKLIGEVRVIEPLEHSSELLMKHTGVILRKPGPDLIAVSVEHTLRAHMGRRENSTNTR